VVKKCNCSPVSWYRTDYREGFNRFSPPFVAPPPTTWYHIEIVSFLLIKRKGDWRAKNRSSGHSGQGSWARKPNGLTLMPRNRRLYRACYCVQSHMYQCAVYIKYKQFFIFLSILLKMYCLFDAFNRMIKCGILRERGVVFKQYACLFARG